MSLADAVAAIGARMSGGDARFEGVSTDTRSVRPGELFFALRGERFDGHAFLERAQAAGAVAGVVDSRYNGRFPFPVAIVDDTRRALGDLSLIHI